MRNDISLDFANDWAIKFLHDNPKQWEELSVASVRESAYWMDRGVGKWVRAPGDAANVEFSSNNLCGYILRSGSDVFLVGLAVWKVLDKLSKLDSSYKSDEEKRRNLRIHCDFILGCMENSRGNRFHKYETFDGFMKLGNHGINIIEFCNSVVRHSGFGDEYMI